MECTLRVDDLGRICIPEEIRIGLKINNGDKLSISTDGSGNIVLRKYTNDKLKHLLLYLLDTFTLKHSATSKLNIIVAIDVEGVVACTKDNIPEQFINVCDVENIRTICALNKYCYSVRECNNGTDILVSCIPDKDFEFRPTFDFHYVQFAIVQPIAEFIANFIF